MAILKVPGSKYEQLIDRGLNYLVRAQRPNGSFETRFSLDKNSLQNARKYQPTFTTALILSCLNSLDSRRITKLDIIRKKAATYLLSQRSSDWTWNYWARDSRDYEARPYPDDLDDTFCTLAALWQFDLTISKDQAERDQSLLDGSALAKITTVLTALEEKEGGPYRTWVVPDDADPVWKDIDLAVNSNVAYFLSLLGIALPNVTSMIEKAVNQANYLSPYYPSPLPVIYFISRGYQGEKMKKIVDFLSAERQGRNWSTPLNTALAITSLLNLGGFEHIDGAVEYLKKSIERDHWSASAFWIDFSQQKKSIYAGSPALTTAFCLEALAKFQQATASKIISQQRDPVADRIIDRVISKVRDRLALGRPLASLAREALAKKLSTREKQSILLLPLLFKRALGRNGAKIDDGLLTRLGEATLYGWLAYTIYDDFLDAEGDPKMLPVANLALRELTIRFNGALPGQRAFQRLFQEIMDELEEANAWEVTFARGRTVPDYGNLSQLYKKSFGHALGPLTILFSLGFSENSSAIKQTTSFFRHYLLARQLNDDAHDWEEDLKAGRVNAVGALVLSKVRGVKSIDKAIEEGRHLFWEKIIVEVCQRLLKEVDLARQALRANPAIEKPEILEPLLSPLEESAQRALTERSETRKFLKTYGAS